MQLKNGIKVLLNFYTSHLLDSFVVIWTLHLDRNIKHQLPVTYPVEKKSSYVSTKKAFGFQAHINQ